MESYQLHDLGCGEAGLSFWPNKEKSVNKYEERLASMDFLSHYVVERMVCKELTVQKSQTLQDCVKLSTSWFRAAELPEMP